MWPLPSNFAGMDFANTNPLEHPGRTLFTVLFASYFTYLALSILRNVKVGVTLEIQRQNPLSLKIHPGKTKSGKTPKNVIRSYNGPVATAVLGIFLYAAAHLLIVLAFKVADYYFI